MRADIKHRRRSLRLLRLGARVRVDLSERVSEHARHRSRRALQLAARNFFAEEDDCREEHDDSLRASRGRGQGTSRGARHNGRALSPWQNWSPPVTPGSGGRAPESPSAWARAHAPVQMRARRGAAVHPRRQRTDLVVRVIQSAADDHPAKQARSVARRGDEPPHLFERARALESERDRQEDGRRTAGEHGVVIRRVEARRFLRHGDAAAALKSKIYTRAWRARAAARAP